MPYNNNTHSNSLLKLVRGNNRNGTKFGVNIVQSLLDTLLYTICEYRKSNTSLMNSHSAINFTKKIIVWVFFVLTVGMYLLCTVHVTVTDMMVSIVGFPGAMNHRAENLLEMQSVTRIVTCTSSWFADQNRLLHEVAPVTSLGQGLLQWV